MSPSVTSVELVTFLAISVRRPPTSCGGHVWVPCTMVPNRSVCPLGCFVVEFYEVSLHVIHKDHPERSLPGAKRGVASFVSMTPFRSLQGTSMSSGIRFPFAPQCEDCAVAESHRSDHSGALAVTLSW